MKKILIVIFLGFVVLSVAWAYQVINRPLPLEHPLVLEMPQGAGVRTLSQKLSENNLFEHGFLLRLIARYKKIGGKLKAGEYEIRPMMSVLDVLDLLVSGKVVLHKIRLPEGKTTHQLLEIIAAEPLLTGEVDFNVPEGALLPETYTFHKGAKRSDIIRYAKNAMTRTLERVWQNRAADLPLDNQGELLVLASIVEKETGRPDERAIVASVFINRLNKGMLLQTDPTVIYALTQGKGDLERSLKHKDLSVDSPFNTYKYAGLPPAPICNPSLAALEAAAHPEDTPYLYFVANGEGGHNFSRSLKEHNNHIKAWLKKRK